ncbi:hypothetical protein D3C78_1259760 [compost metagenome]
MSLRPPSITIVVPAINPACSLARNKHKSPTSSGAPRRPTGCLLTVLSRASLASGWLSNQVWLPSVSIKPGAIPSVRIAGPHSIVRLCTRESSARLLMLYGAQPGRVENAWLEVITRITPRLWVRAARAHLARYQCERRLRLKLCVQSSSSQSMPLKTFLPALETTISIRWNRCSALATKRFISVVCVTSTES